MKTMIGQFLQLSSNISSVNSLPQHELCFLVMISKFQYFYLVRDICISKTMDSQYKRKIESNRDELLFLSLALRVQSFSSNSLSYTVAVMNYHPSTSIPIKLCIYSIEENIAKRSFLFSFLTKISLRFIMPSF